MPTINVSSTTAAERIVASARRLLTDDPSLPMAAVARAAGVSRATLHRYYRTRADLLAAADVAPDPVTRDRVLAAAAELIGRDGLSALSMDEVAVLAQVSRASVYRLFPGKAAVFEALVTTYSPFEPIVAYITAVRDRPIDEVVPGVYRLAAPIAAANIGILRAIFLEVTGGSPEAVEGVGRPLGGLLAALGGYLEVQMDAGAIPRMHAALAVQALLGPLVFHLLTRAYAERFVGLDTPLEASVETLGSFALRGLRPPPRPQSPAHGRDAITQE